MLNMKYQKKVTQIADIIEQLDVEYEDWREDIYTVSSPSRLQSEKAAKEILSKLGVNPPKT